MIPPFPTRILYVTPKEFSRMYEIIAKYGRFDDPINRLMVELLEREFGLQRYTNYRVVVVP